MLTLGLLTWLILTVKLNLSTETIWNRYLDIDIGDCLKAHPDSPGTPNTQVYTGINQHISLCYSALSKRKYHSMYVAIRRNTISKTTMPGVVQPIVAFHILSSSNLMFRGNIKVIYHPQIRINVTFDHFSMGYSGQKCPYDHVLIPSGVADSVHRLCGKRSRFNIIVESSTLIIAVNVSGSFQFRLSFLAQPVHDKIIQKEIRFKVLDISDMNMKSVSSNEGVLMTNNSMSQFCNVISSTITYCESNWVIRSQPGFKIEIEISRSDDFIHIEAFEGPLKFHEMQIPAKEGFNITTVGPVMSLRVRSKYDTIGHIRYSQSKAILDIHSIEVFRATKRIPVTTLCTPTHGVVYCLVTLISTQKTVNMTVQSYNYNGPDTNNCLYSDISFYDSKFEPISGPPPPMTITKFDFFYDIHKMGNVRHQNAKIMSVCREDDELYRWPYISSGTHLSILVVGYKQHIVNLEVSATSVDCQGIRNTGDVGPLTFLPIGCSIRQQRPSHSDEGRSKLNVVKLFNINKVVSAYTQLQRLCNIYMYRSCII